MKTHVDISAPVFLCIYVYGLICQCECRVHIVVSVAAPRSLKASRVEIQKSRLVQICLNTGRLD